jgi:molecular chaperone DnaJ
MEDNYKLLGVARDASDDDIKKAYRSLSRRYHPDANINNPDKDACELKFKQVQQAYTQIMKERSLGYTGSTNGSPGSEGYRGGYGSQGNNGQAAGYGSRDDEDYGFGGFGSFWGYGGFGSGGNGYRQEEYPYLKAAANYINNGYYEEALNVLSGMQDKSARWYYYSAIANAGRGNNMIALDHAKMAVRLEPDNLEYQRLVRRFENGNVWYQQRQSPYGRAFSSGNLCLTLCAAQTLCSMCVGSGLCTGGYTPGT